MISREELKKQLEFLCKKEGTGFTVAEGKVGTVLVLQVPKGTNRKEVLKEFSQMTRGQLKTTSAYSKQGGVLVDNKFWIVVKELVGGKNLSQLTSFEFAKLGKKTKIDVAGNEVDVIEFNSHQQLEKSIIEGTKSALLAPTCQDTVADFFKTEKFDWSGIAPELVSMLGVYLGEILVGWAFLKGNTHMIQGYKSPVKAEKFLLPLSSKYSTVDSFLIDHKGNRVGISSKFGQGAAASIFTSLIPKGVKALPTLQSSQFKTLCGIAKPFEPKYSAKNIVYHWGIRSLLKIQDTRIDPSKVFDDVKKGTFSKETMTVIKAVENHPFFRAMPSIKKYFNYDYNFSSLSAFFNGALAALLMADSKSKEQIINLLTCQKYWQANLQKDLWKKQAGEVKFSFVQSGQSSIKIIGGKSSASDITAKQGWINYILENK